MDDIDALVARITADLEKLVTQARMEPTPAAKPDETVRTLLLSVEEAAQALGISRSAMFDLLKSDAVVSIKIGRRRLVPFEQLNAYIERVTSHLGREA